MRPLGRRFGFGSIRSESISVTVAVLIFIGSPSAGATKYPEPEEDGFFGFTLDEDQAGGRVIGLHPGAAAEKAGLRMGDVVLAVDGESLRGLDHADVVDLLAIYRLGDEVAFSVLREDRPLSFKLVLGPTPEKFRQTPAERERHYRRYKERLQEHNAVEQLIALVDKPTLLELRRKDESSFFIRSRSKGADWQKANPRLVEIFDKHLAGEVYRLPHGGILTIRATPEKSGAIELKTVDVSSVNG